MNVYVEIGSRKVFAGAVEWPGWCRSGKNEDLALRALLDYAPRFAAATESFGLGFDPPGGVSELKVTQRLQGTATTDFGAPDRSPAEDEEPLSEAELDRLIKLWKAAWATFWQTADGAESAQLKKGPRGGGRDVQGIQEHVLGAEFSYLSTLGLKDRKQRPRNREQIERAVPETIRWRRAGNQPEMGRRKNPFWTPQFYVRRSAWHLLDHAWEIEDRRI